jgi:hypothetical protein
MAQSRRPRLTASLAVERLEDRSLPSTGLPGSALHPGPPRLGHDPAHVRAATGIRGVAVVGPVAPVQRPGVPNTQPLAGAVITIRAAGGPEIARATADRHGAFRIALPPGRYLIVPLPPHPGQALPRGTPQAVTVTGEGFTAVVVEYDSGIR